MKAKTRKLLKTLKLLNGLKSVYYEWKLIKTGQC